MEKDKKQNMKIAILSMQRVTNFGSVLQAYSLREILFEITKSPVEFLNIEELPSLPSKKSVVNSVDYDAPAAYPPGLKQRGKRWIVARLSSWNKHLIRAFMKKELSLSWDTNDSFYDCVIVGSDEVFNHNKGVCLQLHGAVKQTNKVISYAASCGSAKVEDIYPEDIDSLKASMHRFWALSVRDVATEHYVSSLYEGNVERHLDPVLIGNLCCRAHQPVRLKKYLLVYAYGQRIRTAEEINTIRSFAKARNLKVVAMGGSQFWCDRYIPTTPFRLMDYFYYADYVVTDTFHGVIFSVINQRKFAVIPRKTNWNKITSLLKDLELDNKLVTDLSSLEQILAGEINYAAVESILTNERERSRAYLKEQLEVQMWNP